MMPVMMMMWDKKDTQTSSNCAVFMGIEIEFQEMVIESYESKKVCHIGPF
jgi:hypothetical protein